ncbi:MAG: GntR family transcriptional regulator [Chromatiaceae bacterium]|nr:GntR family transcriptional regulator [Gammaproteobacteria bacterium]MCP5317080.1 GntR family transcriptional regulator [Chromatiaceae bacterium]MCW5584945.1 GntR family transcriptional regulator [Chromatiales bacterium]MCP5428665.1 GntR family transcriptional regulator [Chromatiaceae bacterium]MCP5434608.1 GntR family transcriptional regulator [Chromatiaceae bacterium]
MPRTEATAADRSAGSLSAVAGGTIPDRIFSLLREAIVEGEIPPGSKISEPELARRYGISRGPLREAIGRLEACGLVVRRPNVGARVVTMSSRQLLEIFHVREALEGMAARLAAQNMSDEEIVELRRLLEQHGQQIAQDADHAYFQREGDLDFHYRIVQGSHNARIVDLLCNDLYHLVRLYRYQFGMASKRGPRAFVEHEHIVDAIERRDAEMAELMMRAHVRASRENVERLLAVRK